MIDVLDRDTGEVNYINPNYIIGIYPSKEFFNSNKKYTVILMQPEHSISTDEDILDILNKINKV